MTMTCCDHAVEAVPPRTAAPSAQALPTLPSPIFAMSIAALLVGRSVRTGRVE